MSENAECRKLFEEMCRFMRVDFSLEWDNAGFYSQLEADRCYTWFKLGFERAGTRSRQDDKQYNLVLNGHVGRVIHGDVNQIIQNFKK